MADMCGRYSIAIETEELEAIFGVSTPKPLLKRYNAAPLQELPVILNTAPETVALVRWGLAPAWMKKMKNRRGLINVRAETLRDRPTFRRDFKERRCLIPTDGFYEWKKDAAGRKIPYRITLQDGSAFAFAGIWQMSDQDSGPAEPRFAIITTTPNPLIATIHNRMPVMLLPDQKSAWLSGDADVRELLGLLRPIDEGEGICSIHTGEPCGGGYAGGY
jgi:putative SOS response-associated peptidase YedK